MYIHILDVQVIVTQQIQNILYYICTMLDQRWRRWSNIVQMLYKCFVFAGQFYDY